MVVSPSLSHSSQVKATYQREIKYYEQVSDECSSGVMRAWHVAQSIPDVSLVSPAQLFFFFGGTGKKSGLVALASTTCVAHARSYSCVPIRLLYSVT